MLDKIIKYILWPVNLVTGVLSFLGSLIDGIVIAVRGLVEHVCFVGVRVLLVVFLYQLVLGDLLDKILAAF